MTRKTNSKKNKRAGKIARMVLRRDFGCEPVYLRISFGIDREMRPAISVAYSMHGGEIRHGKLLHHGSGLWKFDAMTDNYRRPNFTVTSPTHRNKTRVP